MAFYFMILAILAFVLLSSFVIVYSHYQDLKFNKTLDSDKLENPLLARIEQYLDNIDWSKDVFEDVIINEGKNAIINIDCCCIKISLWDGYKIQSRYLGELIIQKSNEVIFSKKICHLSAYQRMFCDKLIQFLEKYEKQQELRKQRLFVDEFDDLILDDAKEFSKNA